jgi:hypothetical protein
VQEISLLNGLWRWPRIIECSRISTIMSVCMRPETIGETLNDRFNKRLMRVTDEKFFELRDIDTCDDLEKFRVSRDGIYGFEVKKFSGRNMRQWHCALSPQRSMTYTKVEIIPHEIANPAWSSRSEIKYFPKRPFLGTYCWYALF